MSSTADLRLPFAVRPLTPKLGAEISGIELARGVTPQIFRAIYDAFLRYQVLLFPPQDVPPAAQVAFARQFGEVQVHVMSMYHADGFPELYRLSNLDEKGRPNGKHPDKGTLAWHTDGSWRRVSGQATPPVPRRGVLAYHEGQAATRKRSRAAGAWPIRRRQRTTDRRGSIESARCRRRGGDGDELDR